MRGIEREKRREKESESGLNRAYRKMMHRGREGKRERHRET